MPGAWVSALAAPAATRVELRSSVTSHADRNRDMVFSFLGVVSGPFLPRKGMTRGRGVYFKVVSGGQTGADRAALDWAIARGLPHGGWCPRGRRAEDGRIAPRYRLTETPSDDYPQRTEWNVRDADGTVILSLSPTLTGGSKKTAEFAVALGKPWLHVARDATADDAGARLRRFVETHGIRVLNVAGPRASTEPEIGPFVQATLERAFGEPSGR